MFLDSISREHCGLWPAQGVSASCCVLCFVLVGGAALWNFDMLGLSVLRPFLVGCYRNMAEPTERHSAGVPFRFGSRRPFSSILWVAWTGAAGMQLGLSVVVEETLLQVAT